MGLRDDLLAWSRDSLPLWQQDALRRLFQAERLSEEDYEQLLLMLKAQHGLDPGTSPEAVPLSPSHIPGADGGDHVQLIALNNLTHVNGFPAGRCLSFASDGLTVVFGGNGAGKSGYARVLKSACRARHVQPVRPNAYESGPRGRTPSAEVVLSVRGQQRTFTWTEGGPADVDLGAVSVYDSACAEDYIEDEGTPAFKPFGLAKLSSLVKVSEVLEQRVRAEMPSLSIDRRAFDGLRGETAVGRLIANLGENLNLDEVRQLGALSDAEIARIAEITLALAETNPEPRAKELERLSVRLDSLAGLACRAKAYTTDQAVGRLKELVRNEREAKEAHAVAQALLEGHGLLPGTGGDAWRRLFRAAQEFAAETYSGRSYPDADSRCVLCQSELGGAAQDRLRMFSEFVEGVSAKAEAEARSALETAVQRIQACDFTLGIDEALAGEIRDQLPGLSNAISDVTAGWGRRRTWMLDQIKEGDWSNDPGICDVGLDEQLSVNAEALRGSARSLRAAADPKARNVLDLELKELKAREALIPLVAALEQFVANAIRARKLNECLGSLQTGPISRKLTALTQTYVSEALVEAMREELSLLRFDHDRAARLRVNRRTERGQTLVRVALELTDVPAHDVLSEGEQRAIALAFFLAEMRLASPGSALIFDDPVTSLDHRYRHAVAQRLAALARDRQVIVLTHDSVFLMALHDASRDERYQVAYRTIGWRGGPGFAVEYLDWDNMSAGQRLGNLRQRHKEIAGIWEEQPSAEAKRQMAEAYSDIRGTIERLVRDDLINKVVEPYVEEVKVEKFGALVGIPAEDFDALIDVYDRACETTRAHDTSAQKQLEPPPPSSLLQDIETLDQIRLRAVQRRKDAGEAQSRRGEARRALPTRGSQKA